MDIKSLSMRGAQREVTGLLIDHGYDPARRWENERALEAGDEGVAVETSRRFKPTSGVANLLRGGGDGSAPATSDDPEANGADDGDFYVYENWTNTFALIHQGTCSFCRDGQGNQGVRGNKT
ncbi:MAG: hypothetical protein ACRDVP_06945, partial [Acidimicrobiales bacterium]